ncbi:protein of unknown function [Modestobacter italicus]|uniref:Uncharacterized protein n=1 Tax=Modestobacter italicus (strain DSM 44449 / CECT 9708 / BC 501) TaxID=2732864 RepID=I4F4Z2_MODI5|nr:hypothetical protein [Modestobacter marinus]CCH90705.1 protein of unknown function [Modestobacter marinus]
MSDEELRRLVGWTVEDAPPEVRAGQAFGALLKGVSAVVTLGADAATGARRPTWAVPADPAAYLDLGVVRLHWPAGAAGEQVQASRETVWATSGRAERPPRRLPVETWQVRAAVPGSGSRRPRHAAAPWRLDVTDGAGTGQLTGAWLALAWIGRLAGWPEPTGTGPGA